MLGRMGNLFGGVAPPPVADVKLEANLAVDGKSPELFADEEASASWHRHLLRGDVRCAVDNLRTLEVSALTVGIPQRGKLPCELRHTKTTRPKNLPLGVSPTATRHSQNLFVERNSPSP